MTQAPLPNPTFYPKWEDWARSIAAYLREAEEQRQVSSYRLPVHSSALLPSADSPGLLIYLEDEGLAALSTATGGWKRLRFAT
jgi:hypothetical protein